jgi:uncharacterized protein YjdB
MPIPGQGAVDVASPTLSWKTGTQSANSYIVYFGTSLDPPQVDTTSGTSYNAGALSDGVVYYWRVDQVTSSGTIQGKLWAFRAKGTGTVYTLTTSVDGQGSISPSGGGYSAGSIVTLTAAGETGWKFDHWGGEVSGSDNPISITMDRDKTVTATFIQASTYNLTSSVTGQGTISPSNGTYNEGDVVSITPNPYAGWRFDGWGGDASGTDDPLLLTMDADKNITATFVEILEGYTYCSDEGETCTYTGTVDIAYGADGQFNYLYDQSSGSCDCNNDTFGDPIYGVRKACYVKPIGDVSVAGVTVSPTTASIGVGATTQLTATVSPSNATNKNVSWSSSDPAVATVDSSGLVAGVAEGSATITVTTEDGGFAATANVTVSSDQSTDYTYCSDEGETCTYTGTVDIAYGADGQFNYLYNQSSGSIGCNNSTFGDPIYGVRKACYVKPASTITDNVIVRARGTNGDEQISLVVDGVTIETWTLTTSYQDYSATASGTVQVHFLNDQGRTRDAQIDYVIIDNVTYQSEDQPTNTGVWQNHSCGGSYSEWLHCNGYIEY